LLAGSEIIILSIILRHVIVHPCRGIELHQRLKGSLVPPR
jgi:hypothetical protein